MNLISFSEKYIQNKTIILCISTRQQLTSIHVCLHKPNVFQLFGINHILSGFSTALFSGPQAVIKTLSAQFLCICSGTRYKDNTVFNNRRPNYSETNFTSDFGNFSFVSCYARYAEYTSCFDIIFAWFCLKFK